MGSKTSLRVRRLGPVGRRLWLEVRRRFRVSFAAHRVHCHDGLLVDESCSTPIEKAIAMSISLGKEWNRSANGPNRPSDYVRQVFVATLHPEPVQVDLHQLGAEFPFHRRKKLHVWNTKSPLIGKWVSKVENCARSHHCLPCLSRSASVKKIGSKTYTWKLEGLCEYGRKKGNTVSN